MTARDRTVLIVVGLLAALAASWFLAISPKRKEAKDVAAQVTTAQARLDAAQASAATAEAARKRYSEDYSTVARLGKAVPVDDDMPSLVYQLESTAHANHVDFRSIKLTASASAQPTGAAAAVASTKPTTGTTPGATGATNPASTLTSALPPGATVGAAGFPTMPFSFDFNGSFFNMQRFLKAIDGLTTVDGKSISVKGRLLTVDGVNFKASGKGFPDVDATVVVTAYLLPADEGLTAGASVATPSSGTATASTTGAAGATPTASLIGSDR
ncbi:MAG TPA: type 4a pilus biogenesis protein PilO [Baekduia sp.]|nr:type 4a pilus biogenesis protein PilO [Baekduia sp.]